MPIWVEKASYAERAPGAPAVALVQLEVNRTCELAQYDKLSIPGVDVQGEIIAYASPDSTYAVTKKLFDAANKSILIGIYDFTAAHIRQLVLDAMARGSRFR